MKKIYIICLAALAALSAVSCEDYLNRAPLDANSDATNWSSEASLEIYANKFYGYLSEMSYGSGWTKGQYHGETLTDDYASESFVEFTKNIPNAASSWSTPYDRIRAVNILLNRIPQVPNLNETAAKHWEGVGRFFRALYHYNLVRVYGDVVWVDDEIDFSKEEEVTRARDSRVTVMDNVVADLQFAVDNCYDPAKAGANKINKNVAAALLSRVALYEGAWEKYHNVAGGHPDKFYEAAAAAAKKVMDSGLYEVTDNYKGMYTQLSLAGSKEVILYKVYAVANINGSKNTDAHGQYGWVIGSSVTWGLTKSAIDNYTDAQGIPVHMNPDYSDATLDGVFANRDARLGATVYGKILPVVSNTWENGIVSSTGYWTYKFVDLDNKDDFIAKGTWNAPLNDTDGPVFQYSEVLLNYAEAKAELGQLTQADLDASVNLLRTKHGKIPALTVAGTDVTVAGTAITKDANDPAATVLLQELRRERRTELMADGFRHDDLMRWALGKNLDTKLNPAGYVGAAKSAVLAIADKKAESDILEKNFWTKDGYKSPYNTSAVGAEGTQVDRTWDDKYYLEPVPAGQILLDPNLGQNDGWK